MLGIARAGDLSSSVSTMLQPAREGRLAILAVLARECFALCGWWLIEPRERKLVLVTAPDILDQQEILIYAVGQDSATMQIAVTYALDDVRSRRAATLWTRRGRIKIVGIPIRPAALEALKSSSHSLPYGILVHFGGTARLLAI